MIMEDMTKLVTEFVNLRDAHGLTANTALELMKIAEMQKQSDVLEAIAAEIREVKRHVKSINEYGVRSRNS